MNTVKTNVIGVLMMSAIVASCGGSNDQLVGVFSDSPVGGINFATQTISGVTDTDGSFRYRDGCLLYTSPSPRDRQKSRMPSSA